MKKTLAFFVLAILSLAAGGCQAASSSSSSSVAVSEGKYYLFDSYVDIKLYGGTAAEVGAIGDYLSSFSSLIDAYTEPEAGEVTLWTVNHTNEELEVPQALANVLSFALEMEKETDGYLNPLIGNLANLWKDGIEASVPYIPAQKDIDAALAELEASALTVEGTKVKRTGGAIVDLGALGKGYALREVQKMIEGYGLAAYLVDAGSSSMIMGAKDDGSAWRIGFNIGEGKPTPAILSLKDSAMGTSSVTEQGAVIDGATYSHIVNPFTGSAKATYVLASAIGPDPGIDDVMSTCFFLMGEDIAQSYAAKMGLGYCFYDFDGHFTYSPDLEVTLV
jgi:thiamine biosynthesis lipoprotein